jgi:GNAT superfamily N-acetyltransferase
MTVVIRPFAKVDVEDAVELWERAWSPLLPDAASQAAAWRHRLLEEILPRLVVIAAEVDARIAGYAIVDLRQHNFDHLVVDPAHGRRGVGSLLAHAARGLVDGAMDLRILEVNVVAIAFWERLGCRRTGTTTSPSTGWASFVYRWG